MEILQFFVYDTLKIFFLFAIVVFGISFLRSYVPPRTVRAILSRKNPFVGSVLAALLGTVTPFCSCSAVPLFIGFVQAGVPLGATFSFLVASPMVNEVALVLLLGLFGWKIAAIYVASGLVIAVVSGLVIGRMRVERLIEPYVFENSTRADARVPDMTARQRAAYAKKYTVGLLKKVWPYVVVGVGVGAVIHGYVPADLLARFAGADKWYAVPLAVIVGVPLYSNAAGVIPLVGALTEKGVAMGTALAFMMAVTALSFPEFVILKNVMKTRLIALFASVVAVGIVCVGYLFNALIG